MKELIRLICDMTVGGNKEISDLEALLKSDKSYFVANAGPLYCDFVIARRSDILVLVIEDGYEKQWLSNEERSDSDPPMWLSSTGSEIPSPIFSLRHAKRLLCLSMMKAGIKVNIATVLLVRGEILGMSTYFSNNLTIDHLWHNMGDLLGEPYESCSITFNASLTSPVYDKINAVITSCKEGKMNRQLLSNLPDNDEDICEPGAIRRMFERDESNGNLAADVFGELDSLVGLSELKARMHETAVFLAYNNQVGGRHNDSVHLHAMFLGNPGTGKTTVASIYAKLLHSLGLLSGEGMKVISRNDIVGEFYGSVEKNLNRYVDDLEHNGGGVLFVDEAYSLAPPNDHKDPGWDAIQCLMRIMDTHPKIVLVFAGYEREMRSFLDFNPGFKSRLHNNVFRFTDFSETELIGMVETIITDKGYTLEDEAQVRIASHVHEAYSCRDRYFGNGRFARTLADETFIRHAGRIMAGCIKEETSVMTITAADIPEYRPSIDVSEKRIGFSL